MPEKMTFEKMIANLYEERKYASIRDVFKTMNPADIAAIFQGLEEEETKSAALFRLLPKELAAESFVEMSPELQENLIIKLSDNELKQIVDELYLDDAVDLVEEMPANVVKRILKQADPETRAMINEMLKYPEDSAGGIMTTEFVYFHPDYTVADAIKKIRRTGVDSETINNCYVTDTNGTLVGTVTIRRLLLSDEEQLVGDVRKRWPRHSESTASLRCPWWTEKTGWWVSSPLTTPSTSSTMRLQKTLRSWPLSLLPQSRISKPAFFPSGKAAFPGFCSSWSLPLSQE